MNPVYQQVWVDVVNNTDATISSFCVADRVAAGIGEEVSLPIEQQVEQQVVEHILQSVGS